MTRQPHAKKARRSGRTFVFLAGALVLRRISVKLNWFVAEARRASSPG
jgi:hypothetical protein